MPSRLALLYRAFRVIDAALLVAGLIGVIAWFPDQVGPAVLVAGVWIFGVVEYLNYFAVRLAYPVGRWWSTVGQRRRPRLVQDIDAAR